jgi:large subunit ribosomal protein L24e
MKCTFCKTEISRGTGKISVQADGKLFYFCSRKCEKNMTQLKRKPRTTKWTGEYHEIKAGERKSKKSKEAPKPAKDEKKEGKA